MGQALGGQAQDAGSGAAVLEPAAAGAAGQLGREVVPRGAAVEPGAVVGEVYLSDSGARPLHRDATGTLWRIDLAGDEPVVMVEVLNSTPEPDGTHRTYWLRVPPATRTAREGVAWTFGLGAEVYEPLRET